jgi:hypothetical protein
MDYIQDLFVYALAKMLYAQQVIGFVRIQLVGKIAESNKL